MNKALKILTAASLMLTVATTAAMAANVQDAPKAAAPRSADAWNVHAYPGEFDSGIAYDTADTNYGYCAIFSWSYSSSPDRPAINFTSNTSYDSVNITNSTQSPKLYYKPSVKYGDYVRVNYYVNAGNSRIDANGIING